MTPAVLTLLLTASWCCPCLAAPSWTSPVYIYQRPIDAMVDVTNDLGVAVLQDHVSSRSNFAFSPYGVASVLVLLYEGARGESARQIHNALRFPWQRDVTRIGFRDIHRHLRTYFSHEGYLSGITLSKNHTSLLPEYQRVLRFYGYDVSKAPMGGPKPPSGDVPVGPANTTTASSVTPTAGDASIVPADSTTSSSTTSESETEEPTTGDAPVVPVDPTISSSVTSESETEEPTTGDAPVVPANSTTSSSATPESGTKEPTTGDAPEVPANSTTSSLTTSESGTEEPTTGDAPEVPVDPTTSSSVTPESGTKEPMAGDAPVIPANSTTSSLTTSESETEGTTTEDAPEVSANSTTSSSATPESGTGKEPMADYVPVVPANITMTPVSGAGEEMAGDATGLPADTTTTSSLSLFGMEKEMEEVSMIFPDKTSTSSSITISAGQGEATLPDGATTQSSDFTTTEETVVITFPSTMSEALSEATESEMEAAISFLPVRRPVDRATTTPKMQMREDTMMAGVEAIMGVMQSLLSSATEPLDENFSSPDDSLTTEEESAAMTTNEEGVVEVTTSASVDEEDIVEVTTSASVDEDIVEVTTSASVDEDIVEVTTSALVDEESVGEVTTSASVVEEDIVEVTTSASVDEESVVEVTTSASVVEESIVEVTTSTSVDEEGVVEVTTRGGSPYVELTTSSVEAVDEEGFVEVTTSASVDEKEVEKVPVEAMDEEGVVEVTTISLEAVGGENPVEVTTSEDVVEVTLGPSVEGGELSVDEQEALTGVTTEQEPVTSPAAISVTTLVEATNQSEARSRRALSDPGSLDYPDISLQLQNGMYGSHVSRGDALYTQLPKHPFLVDGVVEELVPVMSYTAVFLHAYVPRLHAHALEFPLDDERYKLLLILPVERRGLRQLIYDLSSCPLREIYRALRPTRVHAVIPSFMVEGFVILTSTLQQLGIWDVFDPRRSDLSGMSSDPELYVRNIEQSITVVIRNYVEIVDIQTRTMAARGTPQQFQATHPFLYFVVDAETQVSLMAGKIVDPLNSRIY